MSNCATCGRPRTGAESFCAGCGASFGDAPGGAAPAPGAGAPDTPVTRLDIPGMRPEDVGGTRRDLPAMPAYWPEPPAGLQPPPGGPRPPSPRRGGTALLIAVVVVAVLAAGGGAFALVSSLTGHRASSQQSSPPPSSAPASPGTAATTPAGPTATASASPTASGGTSTVAMSSAAAANPAATQVRAFVERYFTAINAHDYAAFSSLLDARMRQQNPQSEWTSGNATTRDSAETLTSIADTGGGGLAATVSFTSHQSPADSINNSSCTAWTITLYLQPQGGSYLIGVPPAGYQSVHRNCP